MIEQDGWESYRKLFESDREHNNEKFDKVFSKLDTISDQLVVIRTERKIGGWVMGVMVPAVVALVFTGVARAFGW
jgi:hypothetical protein